MSIAVAVPASHWMGWRFHAHSTAIPVPARGYAVAVASPDDLESCIRRVAASSDRAAFNTLFRHFAPRITGFLIRSGARRELAEELAQETLVTVWRKAAQFDPGRASPATWVYTIARNLWVDEHRRSQHGPAGAHTESWLEDLPMAEGSRVPEEEVLGAQRQRAVREAIAALSPTQAEVMRRAYFAGQSQSQIAGELRLSLGTVKSRARLALEHLKDLLDGNYL
jgi:RNA polymerase sigma factor (sigma-70 family)